MSKQFNFKQFNLAQVLSLIIWPIDWILSGATTPNQSGPGSGDNEGVLRIPQSSYFTGTSPSDCLVSHTGHSLEGVLPLCRESVRVFYSPSQLGSSKYGIYIYIYIYILSSTDRQFHCITTLYIKSQLWLRFKTKRVFNL